VTVSAPSNIAFIKYWGARDLERVVPCNPSISMTLSRCRSHTTVRFEPGAEGEDLVEVAKRTGRLAHAAASFADPVRRHLKRMRAAAGVRGRFTVATRNNFPAASGLASSASGFAALTLAVSRALEMDLSAGELSSMARLSGSGSAARSTMGGYVEWPAGPGDHECHAVSLAPPDHWDLRDVAVIVESGAKAVSSRDGHRIAATSPHFETRQRLLAGRLDIVREAIRSRDLATLGPVLEEEAIELHLVAMSSRPPVFYWKPETLHVLDAVRLMRSDGVEAYSTMDAGANVHVICSAAFEPEVVARLEPTYTVLRDGVGTGPRDETEHLF
jgi:diphosphomevalonate decarboxylase